MITISYQKKRSLFYNINPLSDCLQCLFLNTVKLNFAIPSATISLRPAILRIVDPLLPLFNYWNILIFLFATKGNFLWILG